MPRYNPEDAINGGLFPDGLYEAVVKRASNEVSKKPGGSEYIALILTLYGPDGAETDVFDNLVFHPKMIARIQHFCDSAGIDFKKGQLEDEDCTGRNVRVKIGFKDDEYGKRNIVKDYLLRNSNTGAPVSAQRLNREPIDSDIPF